MGGFDYKDWSKKVGTATLSAQPQVVYRTVEMSDAWQQVEEWLADEVKLKEKDLENQIQALRNSGDYSHEGLTKQKALLDITQAELRILEIVTKRLHAYHQEGNP